MNSEQFLSKAKEIVKDYATSHLDKSDEWKKDKFDVYIVWFSYILGNKKCLVSTTLFDGMYYEVTYNTIKNEFYFDAYKKFDNKCIEGE